MTNTKNAGFFDFFRRMLGWKSVHVEPPDPFYVSVTGCVYNATARRGNVVSG